jgi:hypothetical protein
LSEDTEREYSLSEDTEDGVVSSFIHKRVHLASIRVLLFVENVSAFLFGGFLINKIFSEMSSY